MCHVSALAIALPDGLLADIAGVVHRMPSNQASEHGGGRQSLAGTKSDGGADGLMELTKRAARNRLLARKCYTRVIVPSS